MTAVRLRRIGNVGVHVDPGDVVAVYMREKPDAIAVLMSSGVAIPAFLASAAGRDRVDVDDVGHVMHQLTEKRDR